MENEKDGGYVSRYELEKRLDPIEKSVSGLERSFGILEKTFEALNASLATLIKEQRRTNDNLEKTMRENLEHGHKLDNHEKEIKDVKTWQNDFTAKKRQYNSDVIKLIGTILTALISLIIAILTIAYGVS